MEFHIVPNFAIIYAAKSHEVLMRGDVEDLPWLACFLAGLGVPLVIHHPPELQTALRDYAFLLASYAEQIEQATS